MGDTGGTVMSDFSSQHQKGNGRGRHPNSLAAGTANLVPYKRGQSGNPGGRPRGVPRLSNCYERLLRMSVEELQQFRPQNTAEAMALRQVSAALYAWDGLPAVKEITDRTEGKAVQRRIDVTADEAVSKARLLYEMGLRLREQIIEHCKQIACDDNCAERMLGLIPPDDAGVLEAVLATVDEQYHDAVIRELEAME
jgi:hypothetical protein